MGKINGRNVRTYHFRKKPEAIICTHSFPSHAAGNLKVKGLIDVPVINAYTDFFVGGVWAKDGIDLHIVPSKTVGQFLQNEYGVEEQHILVSGIPVHPAMTATSEKQRKNKWELLIAGGNSGLGNLADIARQSTAFDQLHVTILCGNNRPLYEEITQMNLNNVTALPYIDSRDEMNALYERADALVSKPGGVTISEAFVKHVPVFVSSVLPGQEQLNMDYLVQKGLVFPLEEGDMLAQVMNQLMEPQFEQSYSTALTVQRDEVELGTATLVDRMLYQLNTTTMPHFSKKMLLATI
ncbi:MGDG synthase family glycosyltransferase [Kurthia senegalensis]|uniref:MGDG synthase family glycosyltransferase n=1 Tax=Kurthia senegalensis TaxID=1033740 RepID=UPI000A041BAF|nr:glycosyltransferase [Kurthia senegalensis]